jgi:organic radical activating enzyme
MDESPFEMPFLRNIGFLMTYRCQVACPHCIIKAGPHRRGKMRLADALKWIEQVAAYRSGYIKALALTGGEPFFDMTLLRRISGYAAERGVIVSAVTNAFWAATAEEAVTVLRSVPAIQMLAISTDVYHQRSIPFERVKNAILAARDLGIPYNIAVCTEDTDDPEYKQIVAALAAVTPPETIATAITFRAGRALERVAELKYRMTNTPPVSACAAGSSPIVFPSGRVVACIGPVIDLPTKHPLLLGSLRDSTLETILDRAECNSILHAIRVWGPRKLIALASEAGLDQYLPREYVEGSMCQACYSLMASRQIRQFLHALSQNVSFVEKVAYARAYYLKETQMVSMCTKAM